MQNYSSGDENTLTAISVSQLKDIIEKLSNGQDIPYLGLKLTSVTSDIEKEYDIPKGVYIKSVGIDSPAMAAGLQSGDVIVKIAGENVETAQAYKNVLSGQTPWNLSLLPYPAVPLHLSGCSPWYPPAYSATLPSPGASM